MNKDFLKMQKLAGLITESQFKQLSENESKTLLNKDSYQHILKLYIDVQDPDGYFDDNHKKEIALYLNSLKSSYPKVKTAEELASAIKEIDDTVNKISGYPDDLFDEEVIPSLEQVVSNNPELKNAVDETLVVLNKLYGRDDDDDDEDEYNYDEFGHYDNPEQGWNTDDEY